MSNKIDFINDYIGKSNDIEENELKKYKEHISYLRKELHKIHFLKLKEEYNCSLASDSLDYFLAMPIDSWKFISILNGLREMCELAKEVNSKD